MRWTCRALLVICIALCGAALGRAQVEGFRIDAPVALEIDGAGAVVWRSTDFQHPISVKASSDGGRLIAGRVRSKVALLSSGGTVLDTITVPAATDADFLPDGRLLVTSEREGVVRELDRDGRVLWQYGGLKGPRDADRLPNGNTLICDSRASRVIEVDRAGTVVWEYSRDLNLPVDADLDENGQVLIADYNRHFVTCARRDGSVCWRFHHLGHPTEIQGLPDGTVLVGIPHAGMIVRIEPFNTIRDVWRLGGWIEDFSFTPEGNLLLAMTPLRTESLSKIFSAEAASRVIDSYRHAERLTHSSVSGSALMPALVSLVALALGAVVKLRFRSGWAWAAVAVAVVPWLGVRLQEATAKPRRTSVHRETAKSNVVLILFDSLRKDHVPWYGYWRNTTPHLLALSSEALVFDQYITQAPWTKPSVASLLTSTYASNHGAVKQTADSHLPATLVTLPEVLLQEGYYTAAVMENPHMGDKNSTKGFEQGFDDYHFLSVAKHKDQLPALVVDRGMELIERRPSDRPFFLMLFFLNPHYPYEPKQKHFGDKMAGPSNPGPINDYDGEIFEADQQVGRLLELLRAQGLMESSIVVFSTDHGEEFGEHGQNFHGKTLYDPVLNVPLLVTGIGEQGRFPGLVREIDLMPTLLDYLGIEGSEEVRRQMAGVSVRGLIESGAERTGLVAYSETKFTDGINLISKRDERAKSIADLDRPRVEQYDLVQDPQEYNDLAGPSEARSELEHFERWLASQSQEEQPPVSRRPVSEAELEQLRALGYLGDD